MRSRASVGEGGGHFHRLHALAWPPETSAGVGELSLAEVEELLTVAGAESRVDRCAMRQQGSKMTNHPFPDDRKPAEIMMPLPPAMSRLVAQELRQAAALARTRGDLVGAAKLLARADALCPLGPSAIQIGSRA